MGKKFGSKHAPRGKRYTHIENKNLLPENKGIADWLDPTNRPVTQWNRANRRAVESKNTARKAIKGSQTYWCPPKSNSSD